MCMVSSESCGKNDIIYHFFVLGGDIYGEDKVNVF